jgi:tetrapyrrole methylase family protein/MazG family protein
MAKKITVVGLGPGPAGYLSLETLELLAKGPQVILRTEVHPSVSELKKRKIKYSSCDNFYEKSASFEEVYKGIVAFLFKACAKKDVVYAVPGSPLVAEKTVVLLREKAKAKGVKLDIKPAMSFLDPAFTALGVDPIDGLRIIDAQDRDALADGGKYPLMITQVYDNMLASELKLSLMDVLPDEAEIYFLHRLGLKDGKCLKLKLFELDRQPKIDYLTSVYVPKQKRLAEQSTENGTMDVTPLTDVMRVLREPGGCPWDREQDHRTIRANMIEEVYEFIEAVDNEDFAGMEEELGDIMMQVAFHARLAEEKGIFSMQDVIDGVSKKLIHRHPHVFGTLKVKDSAQVLQNWEALKKEEKKDRVRLLDGIYQGLPALLRSAKIQNKVSKAGLNWAPPVHDLKDTLTQLEKNKKKLSLEKRRALEAEIGDFLFTLVGYARRAGIDCEIALNGANNRYTYKFSKIEDYLHKNSKKIQDLSDSELEKRWKQVKMPLDSKKKLKKS